MFIQTEATPNPETLKFIPGKPVFTNGMLEFATAQEADKSPLAGRLFGIEGVKSVFLGSDFVSVTKQGGEWQHLKPAVLGAIMEHFMSGDPVVDEGETGASASEAGEFDPKDEAIVTTIKELLDTRVRPAVAQDGGDISFHSYRDGVVHLKMRGACAGCPSANATLKNGIENLLRHFVPEVQSVEPVE